MSFLTNNLSMFHRALPVCKHYTQFTSKFPKTSRCRSFGTKAKSTNMNVKGIVKLSLAGVTAGALVGTGYSIHKMNQPRAHIINEEKHIVLMKELPDIPPSRKVKFCVFEKIQVF